MSHTTGDARGSDLEQTSPASWVGHFAAHAVPLPQFIEVSGGKGFRRRSRGTGNDGREQGNDKRELHGAYWRFDLLVSGRYLEGP